MGLYSALRKGDLPAVQAAVPANDALAGRLAAAAEQRQAAATRLAAAVGLAGESFTLASLADRTPEPYRSGLRTTRAKLRESDRPGGPVSGGERKSDRPPSILLP